MVLKKKVTPVDDYGKDDPIDPKILAEYRWGVFKGPAGKYVNKYFPEMKYSSMLKGPFLTKEEAEQCL